MYYFTLIHSHAKKLYLNMFDMVDTAFSYEKEWIICSFLQEFSNGKGSSCNSSATHILHYYFVGQNSRFDPILKSIVGFASNSKNTNGKQ